MNQTEITVFLCALPLLGWIYYQIQKRIGEDQARDWKEFVAANPQYFHNPEPVVGKSVWTDGQKKIPSRNVGTILRTESSVLGTEKVE